MAHLIIDGADCLGKTTAARRAAALSGWPLIHMTRPPADFDHFGGYAQALLSCQNAVHDRFHLGALVYGSVATDQRQLHDPEARRAWTMAHRLVHAMGAVTIIMYSSSNEWLSKQLKKDEKRGQMYDAQTILDVNRVYRSLAVTTPITARLEHYTHFRTGVLGLKCGYDVSEEGFPNDEIIRFWLTCTNWVGTREPAERVNVPMLKHPYTVEVIDDTGQVEQRISA